jgi:hypothetical protein
MILTGENSMEYWWNDTDRRKLKHSDKNSVSVPLGLPQISDGLAKNRTHLIDVLMHFPRSSADCLMELCN